MKLSIAEALRKAIHDEMERDKTVFCIGEDIGVPGGWGGAFTVTLGLEKDFRDRIIDTPISESGIFGAACGAAIMGMRPIADVQYGDFLFCAMDQVVNQIAKLRYMSGGKIKVPIVMRVPVGATGRGAQHSQNIETYFMCCPGLKILAPSTAYDAYGLLKTAVRDDDPVLFFEHKLLYGAKGTRKEEGTLDASSEFPEKDFTIPIGKGAIRKEGDDVTIIGSLLMSHYSIFAADILEKKGISCEVIDLRSLWPLDTELILTSVKKTGRAVIVEESPKQGGIGAEIGMHISENIHDYLTAPITRIAAPNTPAPFSPIMEKSYIPQPDKIAMIIEDLIKEHPK